MISIRSELLKAGLGADTAKKLEREFEAQEMILRGLQKDNEAKTIEVEQLRRQLRAMSNLMTQRLGEGWSNGLVVQSGTVLRSPVKRALAPVEKRPVDSNPLQQGDTTQWDLDASFVSALANVTLADVEGVEDAEDDGVRQNAEVVGVGRSDKIGRASTPSPPMPLSDITNTIHQQTTQRNGASSVNSEGISLDPRVLLAEIEQTRLLVAGFARRNARRQQELHEIENEARAREDETREMMRAFVGNDEKGQSDGSHKIEHV